MDRRGLLIGICAGLASGVAAPNYAAAASAAELNQQADETLAALKRTQPVTDNMIAEAKGVLIFPKIVKGGLLIGGATGEGVLREGGKATGYYRSSAVSYGLQAGIAKFGYVIFFMDEKSLSYLRESQGWEVGVGPNVTVADEGFATKFSTTSTREGIYVFFVGQKGFFAGAGIEGTKISKISM
jgi:lipid-binding SYLF domain-containing protein